jgi:ribokinase
MQEILAGVLNKSQSGNYGVMVCNTNDDCQQETRCITMLCRNKVDGVLWEKVREESDDSERFFAENDIPFSLIGCLPSGQNERLSVDYPLWGYNAAKKLVDLGHRRVGCVIRPGRPSSQAFFDGFKRCLFENRIVFDEKNCRVTPDAIADDFFLRGFTGFACVDADAGEELCRSARLFALNVPRDLSVVAISDDGKNRPNVNMSLITQPMRAFGEFICEDLIARIERT